MKNNSINDLRTNNKLILKKQDLKKVKGGDDDVLINNSDLPGLSFGGGA